MKKLFALLLCLALLGATLLPAAATEATTTQPTTGGEAATAVNPNGSHVMAVVCLVIVVLGGIYLLFIAKRTRDV